MKLKPFITSLLALLMILPESGKASERIDLTSMAGHRGIAPWRMARVSDVSVYRERAFRPRAGWKP